MIDVYELYVERPVRPRSSMIGEGVCVINPSRDWEFSQEG